MKILTIGRRREILAARFPRVSYFLGSAGTGSALRLVLWAVAVADVASGLLSAHLLWLVAAILALVAFWHLGVAGYHAAVCPCVLDAVEDEDLAFSPDDGEVV